jgi:serine/threonine-protein kinase
VLPESGPPPVTLEELEERKALQQQSERRAQEARKEAEALSDKKALEELRTATREFEAELTVLEEQHARRSKRRWRMAGGAGVLLLGLALMAVGWAWLAPATALPAASEKGSWLVSTLSNSRPVRAVAAWLCVTFTVGCPAAQVRPPPGDCPPEAVESMEKLQITGRGGQVLIDIHQPGKMGDMGIYRPGPITGKVVYVSDMDLFPNGTLLYGQLWTEGLTKRGAEAVYGRYTEALLLDGRRVPVCIVLAGDGTGLLRKFEGSKPGEAVLSRVVHFRAVDIWP